MSGKALFDADIMRQLDSAQNNNERFDLLTRLQTDTIPNFDDISTAFGKLREPLVRAARIAWDTPQVPVSTPYGEIDGHDAKSIAKLVVDILNQLRYAEPVETLEALATLYRQEPDVDLREQIVKTIKALAEFNIPVWKQVGPGVQIALVDYLNALSADEIAAIRPIAMTVWGEALDSDITGTTWNADSVTLSRGAIQVSEAIKTMRQKAMAKLFDQFDQACDDAGRREVLNVLDRATHTPSQGAYSDELRAVALENSKEIVEFLTARVGMLSYELLQHVEHGFLWDYYRSKPNGE
jgi:hypothetical protein